MRLLCFIVLVLACLFPSAAQAYSAPPANAQFDYQIGGAYTPLVEVGIVDRDRHDAAVAGRYNICYINAFQTQPEDAEWWRTNHPDLLLRGSTGRLVVDSAWNEILLDVSTAAKREALLAIEGPWIDGCATAGYQGLEPDNLDSYTRSRRLLRKEQTLSFASLLATRAHLDGLAVAQKNTSELGSSGKTQAGFDFAIAEECQVYEECGEYTALYGTEVFEIEYQETPFNTSCSLRGATISVIRRDVKVVPRGQAGYVYRWC